MKPYVSHMPKFLITQIWKINVDEVVNENMELNWNK
jgi:hypothetical protein